MYLDGRLGGIVKSESWSRAGASRAFLSICQWTDALGPLLYCSYCNSPGKIDENSVALLEHVLAHDLGTQKHGLTIISIIVSSSS